MFSTPEKIILNLTAVVLRVGMQVAALRTDIPKAKFVRQISVLNCRDWIKQRAKELKADVVISKAVVDCSQSSCDKFDKFVTMIDKAV